jgi:hypothetical protein
MLQKAKMPQERAREMIGRRFGKGRFGITYQRNGIRISVGGDADEARPVGLAGPARRAGTDAADDIRDGRLAIQSWRKALASEWNDVLS